MQHDTRAMVKPFTIDDDEQPLKVRLVTVRLDSDAEAVENLQKDIGFAIPRLDSFDDFIAEAARHREIAMRKSEIDQDYSQTMTAIERGIVARRSQDVEAQARAIVAGAADDAFRGSEDLRVRAGRLREEGEAYGGALRLVRERMADICSDRSVEAAEIARPFHRQAVADIAAACAALDAALERERTIRRAVTIAGYDDRLPAFSAVTTVAALSEQAKAYGL